MLNIQKKRVCKCCKKMFMRQRSTQVVCSYECSIELAKIKQKEKEAKAWKVEKAKMKENLKTLSDYEKLARIVFQKWIRQRDKDLPCISCGVTSSDQWHASHYFPAGVYSGLIFDERNVNSSCHKCNTFLHGNIANYRIGLINRYGVEFVEALESESAAKKDYKFTKDELLQITTKYKQLLTNQNKSK